MNEVICCMLFLQIEKNLFDFSSKSLDMLAKIAESTSLIFWEHFKSSVCICKSVAVV